MSCNSATVTTSPSTVISDIFSNSLKDKLVSSFTASVCASLLQSSDASALFPLEQAIRPLHVNRSRNTVAHIFFTVSPPYSLHTIYRTPSPPQKRPFFLPVIQNIAAQRAIPLSQYHPANQRIIVIFFLLTFLYSNKHTFRPCFCRRCFQQIYQHFRFGKVFPKSVGT